MNARDAELSDTYPTFRPLVRRAAELGRGPPALLDWLARRADVVRRREAGLARDLARAVAAAGGWADASGIGATRIAADETRTPGGPGEDRS